MPCFLDAAANFYAYSFKGEKVELFIQGHSSLSLFIKIRRKEAFTRPQYCSYVSSALRSMSKSSFAIAY